ncbi:carboxymuconolactone decarboxylase family protein [Actinoplanes sp. NBRC 101535]|uniref:carboxymuconolactone decarboxylase family protein n=1 Tax=Actinoplanes sp. NBRC 101535 TaxID=3032196 RepID=UPI0024A16218|nr:carboxymuconolactone decarboxylase family protein [Actinoplanes sp. NBRC 101535]GLY05386.1 hypothetical protein Acsp01_57650 [Actinoplanes sp. NBRC 101535]
MTELDIAAITPETYRAMYAFTATAADGLDGRIAALVKVRVSQLNGCSYCVDLHVREAQALGVDDRALHGLAAWRRTPAFEERERAALALAEAVTTAVGEAGVPERALTAAGEWFQPTELAQLLWTIAAVNAWNRIASATGLTPSPAAVISQASAH